MFPGRVNEITFLGVFLNGSFMASATDRAFPEHSAASTQLSPGAKHPFEQDARVILTACVLLILLPTLRAYS